MDATRFDPAADELDRAVASGDAGAVIRIVRQRQGMTQTQLGHTVGYSPSAISRLERGRLRLGDVAVLRLLASALAIPPEMLGVSTVQSRPVSRALASVRAFSEPDGGAVQRRRLLVGTAGFAGKALLSADAFAVPARPTTAEALGNLERVCFTTASSPHAVTISGVKGVLLGARGQFAAGDYVGAARRLTEVLAVESALIEQRPNSPDAYVVLAYAYALATEILIKIGGGATTMIVADRAVRAARTSQSPLAFAAAVRQLATVLRHDGRIDSSIRLAIEAADGLSTAGTNTPQAAAAYAQSLCTAAYIAANSGNRHLALDLVREATETAQRIPPGEGYFDLAGATLYSIGVHYAVDDAAAAVTAASQIRPAQLPTAERRARYWCDVARAWSQYGDPQRTYAALVAAFREAPGEVRDRSSMRGLVSNLVAHDRKLPGLRVFAAKVAALT
jgi:transcriptional regulator with XRE-family HTH domain